MKLTRTIAPEVRIISKTGLVDYVASDESLDSYREIIRASGWRFNLFQKNSPFVDSHDYSSIKSLVGKVVDFSVTAGKLVERVQWAVDVADNALAQLGWKMTEGGYLKAVSVGFWPTKYITAGSQGWHEQLTDMKLPPDAPVRTIYTEQEQVELSTVILGANPNALAKAYKSGCLTEEDLNIFSTEYAQRTTAPAAAHPAHAAEARERERCAFLERLNALT